MGAFCFYFWLPNLVGHIPGAERPQHPWQVVADGAGQSRSLGSRGARC